MLAELFGPTILLTVFHNNKSPKTEPTNTLSATVRGNYDGKQSGSTQWRKKRTRGQVRINAKHPKLILKKKLCFFFPAERNQEIHLISTNISNSSTSTYKLSCLFFFFFLFLLTVQHMSETRRAYVVKFYCQCSVKRLQHHLLAKRQSKKTGKKKQKSFREVGRVQHPLGSLFLSVSTLRCNALD